MYLAYDFKNTKVKVLIYRWHRVLSCFGDNVLFMIN